MVPVTHTFPRHYEYLYGTVLSHCHTVHCVGKLGSIKPKGIQPGHPIRSQMKATFYLVTRIDWIANPNKMTTVVT